jgi:hypothetical protein
MGLYAPYSKRQECTRCIYEVYDRDTESAFVKIVTNFLLGS